MAARWIVTGSGGLLGRHLLQVIPAHGGHVVGVDRRESVVPAPYEYHQIDLETDDFSKIVSAGDIVIHSAAIPGLSAEVTELDVLRKNLASTASVAFAAGAAGATCLVYVSSQSAYGLSYSGAVSKPAYLPIDEDHPCMPVDGYSLSKLLGERLVEAAGLRWGFRTRAIRLPVVWDPNQAEFHITKRLSDPAQGARSNWAYVDVRDASEGVYLAAINKTEGHVLANLGASAPFSVNDIQNTARDAYGNIPGIGTLDPTRPVYSIDRATTLFGYRPRWHWSNSSIEELGV